MSTKTLNRFVLVIPAVLCFVLAGCSKAYMDHEVVASGPVSGPVEVVESFYSSYDSFSGNPTIDGAYRSDERLTPEFVQKVDAIIASFDKGGYDPFLCAQDVPESFTLGRAELSGDTATVVVRTSFEGHAFTVELQQTDGEWKIDDVLCTVSEATKQEPTETGGQIEGWQTFRDDEYGFQLRFPENWTYEEGQLLPPEETPDGQKALRRVLFFEPQAWDGEAPPLDIQVTEGTAEEFGWLYVPATSTESLEINGHSVTKEKEDIGGVQIVRYVFQSPTDESVRIVALDYISGFPERAEGNDEVVDTLQRIIHTVVFNR